MGVSKNKAVGRRVTRRGFLRGAIAAATSPYIIPRFASGQAAASNRLGIGIIGLGSRGMGHTKSFMHASDTQVVAVCDPY